MRMVAMVAVLLLFLMTGCTNSGAKVALENQGYRNVTLTGYKFLKCSDDDIFHTGFTAIAPTGFEVHGTVCEGIFKGKTIRID